MRNANVTNPSERISVSGPKRPCSTGGKAVSNKRVNNGTFPSFRREIDKSAYQRQDGQNHERNLDLVSRPLAPLAPLPHQRRQEK